MKDQLDLVQIEFSSVDSRVVNFDQFLSGRREIT